MPATTATELVGATLRKIRKAAGTSRKYSKLTHECKALLDNLDEVLATPHGAGPAAVEAAASRGGGPPESPAAWTPSSAMASLPEADADGPVVVGQEPTGDEVDGIRATTSVDTEALDSWSPSCQQSNLDTLLNQEAALSDAASTPTAERAAMLEVSTRSPNAPPAGNPTASVAVPACLSDGALLPIMRVMRLGVETGKANVADLCLDLMHKLIASRYMQGAAYAVHVDSKSKGGEDMGDEPRSAAGKLDAASLTPQAQAIELICKCEEILDEGTELQVLRGLLTATCSSSFTLHGQALLLAVRTCYNIFLMSHSEKNQNTAKAALTQMLDTVFQRMEANSVMVQVRPIVVADVLGLPTGSSQDPTSVAHVVQAFLNTVVMTAAYAAGTSLTDNLHSSVAASFQPKQPHGHPMVPDAAEESDDERHHFQLAASSAATSATHSPRSPRPATHAKVDPKINLLQKDAFLVFRALCKLSIRTSDSATMLDATAIRGKVLALELLKVQLENSGPAFRSNNKFMSAVRQYLCLSLLKNSGSSIPQVLSLSCSIFLTLLSKFRQALKAEMGVFFPMILLKTMEPQNTTGANTSVPGGAPPLSATFAHRSVVLRCLRELCQDGQLLVDLFVNYDCDLGGSNLCERMVNGLVKIAQSSLPLADALGGSHHLQNEQFLRQEALHCLVSILESMEKWYNRTQANEDAPPDEREDQVLDATPTATTANPEEGSEGLSTKRANKLKFQEAINLFNKKPMKGIELLQKQGLLGSAPKEVATFLAKTEGLNKTMIGDFMGEREDLAIKVMHAYIDELDFTRLEFDDAIRKFLAGFRLPGEAQKIDRLMEKFAERYVKCNPGSFGSADVAYVLAYSVILLNTDAHNPQVKKKMSREDFLKNNRGINDGSDLPEDFMHNLYHRIVINEIKMKEETLLATTHSQSGHAAKGFMTTLLSLMGAHRGGLSAEPSDDAVKRTLDHLHQKAKGATYFTATDGDTVKPMLDVIWAPMLGALSVLFEEYSDPRLVRLCLSGFSAAVCLTGELGMANLRDVFLNSLCNFTHLHSPSSMRFKNALAFKALLQVAEGVGDHLEERWVDVLRCISRWELLQQIASGMPTDAAMFTMHAQQQKVGIKATAEAIQKRLQQFGGLGTSEEPRSVENLTMNESSIRRVHFHERPKLGAKKADMDHNGIPEECINSVDTSELNHVLFRSSSLDSEAIVHFVRAMCSISLDELRVASAPRVFSLAKIVEIAHFNMSRIRLVWSRIWNVLSEYFIQVGCHSNLSVAMYAVDSLRQLAMKFLDRDELANYTFQNDFLRPFVVVMRQSQSLEIRELIIRCLSQMVLARVSNVKSGWKTMFMVFAIAANDREPTIVRLAFETIEKLVREHFIHITETESSTFTDCVNCLIAFTNNPHSLDVALNSIAFLRFCAMKLADGAIGNTDQLSAEARAAISQQPTQPTRFVPIYDTAARTSALSSPTPSSPSTPATPLDGRVEPTPLSGAPKLGQQFTDKEEHVYFWFPLLAGLSELTFDPREQLRNGAMEVLFDTLRFHGHTFTQSLWLRIFETVLVPIFDHVRAEVTDTHTFTSERRRAEEDAWLYATCTRILQHLIGLFTTFYSQLNPLMGRMLELVSSFVCRTQQNLAGVGVDAFVLLARSVGDQMSREYWEQVMETLVCVVEQTLPCISELVTPPTLADGPAGSSYAPAGTAGKGCNLREGVGARRLAKFKCNTAVQLQLVQACSAVYSSQCGHMPASAVGLLLDALELTSTHACRTDMDVGLRRQLAAQQVADRVPEERSVPDPPLLRLETESGHAYLSVLLHLTTQEDPAAGEACNAEDRLTELCLAVLERFALGTEGTTLTQEAQAQRPSAPVPTSPVRPTHATQARSPPTISTTLSTLPTAAPPPAASSSKEYSPFSKLVVSTLRTLSRLPQQHFRKQLPRTFPLLTTLIRCEYAPPEVQHALCDLFNQKVGPMVLM